MARNVLRDVWHYSKLNLAEDRLRPVRGDPHQLGGDFIVDGAGVIRLAHRSQDPVDRPPVAELLAMLHGMTKDVSA